MTLGQRRISTIGVDLQDTSKAVQMRPGSLCLAIGGIDLGDHRWVAAVPRPIVAGIGPDLAGLGLFATRLEHGRDGLVSEQPLGSSQSLEDMTAQGG
jgi:hypothetical protein